ncbi:MAG: hypothetical protein ACP5QO_03795 [Clostridia bacterium]
MAHSRADTIGEQLGRWLVDHRAVLATLHPELLQTLWGLTVHADASGCVTLAQSALANELGISRNAVAARLARLLAFRWNGQALVERGTSDAFHVPVYRVVVPGELVPSAQVPSPLVPRAQVPSVLGTDETAVLSGFLAPESAAPLPEVSSPQTPLLPHPSLMEQAVLDLKESSLPASASGNSGSDPDPNPLRRSTLTRARTRDDPTSSRAENARSARARARAKPAPDPAVKRLLLRHQALYQAKTGAAFPVAWGRDGKLVKQLLAAYDEATVERLQDAFFAQPLDSVAGRKGYTIPGFFTEAPALAARAARGDALTPEQVQRRASLEFLGCEAATALALVTEVPLDQIDRQLAAWPWRTGIRRPAAALPRAIREDWPVPEADPGWAPLRPPADEPVEAIVTGAVSGRDPVLRALGDVTRDLWPVEAP